MAGQLYEKLVIQEGERVWGLETDWENVSQQLMG